MATIREQFHEYMQQPADVIRAMRFGQWSRAKDFCEGRMTVLQALEAERNENAEVRRQLGWNLR